MRSAAIIPLDDSLLSIDRPRRRRRSRPHPDPEPIAVD